MNREGKVSLDKTDLGTAVSRLRVYEEPGAIQGLPCCLTVVEGSEREGAAGTSRATRVGTMDAYIPTYLPALPCHDHAPPWPRSGNIARHERSRTGQGPDWRSTTSSSKMLTVENKDAKNEAWAGYVTLHRVFSCPPPTTSPGGASSYWLPSF